MNQDIKISTDYLYIAVDLGAGSGRVFLCDFSKTDFSLEEIHRFQYPPQIENNHLRWNFAQIFDDIKHGLRKAGERALGLNRPIYSIGIDSWAVDYGLLDSNGKLIANPVCYRDSRTNEIPEKLFAKISRDRIFEKTGIQFLNFNTIFQLFSENGAVEKADKLLLLPDLINFFLTGKAVTEYTNATTTQMVNAETGKWDAELIKELNLPARLLTEIVPAGTDLGFIKPQIAKELYLQNVRVIAPATHDTGSAVAGAPLDIDWAYISSGTWSLVGVERSEILINSEVAKQNFTNEGGAFGTIRFLKNVMGLWIFESCRREWESQNIDVDYGSLLLEIAGIEKFKGFIFPDDERFLNPPSMIAAINEQLAQTNQEPSDNPAIISKIILDSLAFRYASVIRTIEELTHQKIAGVQIIGGGGRNKYLNQMTANACGLPVKAELTEATVTGNAIVQAISSGRFANLSEARNYMSERIRLKECFPQSSADLTNAKQRYEEVENFYLKS